MEIIYPEIKAFCRGLPALEEILMCACTIYLCGVQKIIYIAHLFDNYVDTSGKIRIWDTTQKEHILKYEYQPISGKIKDIAWSPDSKRIAICGEGREKLVSMCGVYLRV